MTAHRAIMTDGEGVDAVVVLGARPALPGVPSPTLIRRVDHGVSVFRQLQARWLVLSGGAAGAGPSEAALMSNLARARGVAASVIVEEARSRSTFENAVYSGAIIRRQGWENVIVVTDGYHLGRALFIFRRLGLRVEGVGVPRPAHISRWRWWAWHLDNAHRLMRSAVLFLKGTHKPIVASAWSSYDTEP